MTDVTTLTPVEIDTELARLWRLRAFAMSDFGYWAERAAKLAKAKVPSYALDEANKNRDAAFVKVQLLDSEAMPYDLRYRHQRWNRYFLVTNSNGHVHRGMDCTTCYPTTEYAWLVELADCDEAEMVDEFGEKACTVCFPNAPALPAFHSPGRRDREAIEARQAEKDARAAAKAAKALPGGPVEDAHGWKVATKVAARNALSDAVQSYGWYGPTHSMDFLGTAQRMVEALADTEIDTAKVIERAAKKVLKEGGEHDIRKPLGVTA